MTMAKLRLTPGRISQHVLKGDVLVTWGILQRLTGKGNSNPENMGDVNPGGLQRPACPDLNQIHF
jgi:hypothetical protein